MLASLKGNAGKHSVSSSSVLAQEHGSRASGAPAVLGIAAAPRPQPRPRCPPPRTNPSTPSLPCPTRSFNVYVSQPEVKPGCVLRRANFNVLERRGLVDNQQVRRG